MLTAFTLECFKSYRQARLPLGSLTVLIGANAAGKSNAIEALRILSWLAQGQRLSTIQHSVNDTERVVRGRIETLLYGSESVFGLGCEIDGSPWNLLQMHIGAREGELHIVKERVTGETNNVPLYELQQPSQGLSTDVTIAYNNFSRGKNKPRIRCSDQTAIFVQLESAARFSESHQESQKQIPAVVHRFQELLSNILFLDPVPARMREYSFLSDKQLRGDGTNLSSVLYHLWHQEKTEDTETNQSRQGIVDFIRSLPEQDIASMRFLTGPRGEVMVELVETFGGEERAVDASLLSDGTLRVLAVAAAMLSAKEESLVVIEEFDNGVHPSRARHLLTKIQQVAEKRRLRVLLSTHNSTMLDALPDRAVPDVVFCYRDPVDGSSRLQRMQDMTELPELLAQGALGQLMTNGALERFVKSYVGPEERKKKARAWLAQLQVASEEPNQ
jgi:predicted ATPase